MYDNTSEIRMKACTRCKKEFPATLEYFVASKRSKEGLVCQCKICKKKYREKYKEKPPLFLTNPIVVESRVCTECNRELPANKDYFRPEKRTRIGLQSCCRDCDKEYRDSRKAEKYDYDRKRYAANREEILARQKVYMADAEHKDHKREYDKEYRERSGEHRLKLKREYYWNNRDLCLGAAKRYADRERERLQRYWRAYYRQNKESISVKAHFYRKENRDKMNVLSHRYRSRKKKLECRFTIQQWIDCVKCFGGRCAYCGKKRKLEQEHFVPASKGGEYTVNNIIPACKSCNSSKHNSDVSDWYPRQEFFLEARMSKIYRYLRYDEHGTQQLSIL